MILKCHWNFTKKLIFLIFTAKLLKRFDWGLFFFFFFRVIIFPSVYGNDSYVYKYLKVKSGHGNMLNYSKRLGSCHRASAVLSWLPYLLGNGMSRIQLFLDVSLHACCRIIKWDWERTPVHSDKRFIDVFHTILKFLHNSYYDSNYQWRICSPVYWIYFRFIRYSNYNIFEFLCNEYMLWLFIRIKTRPAIYF